VAPKLPTAAAAACGASASPIVARLISSPTAVARGRARLGFGENAASFVAVDCAERDPRRLAENMKTLRFMGGGERSAPQLAVLTPHSVPVRDQKLV
jgi:hypothetical protein